jgi:DNA-binding beta-propeller fold protein YncE
MVTLVREENARPGDGSWVLSAPPGDGLAAYGSQITLHPGDPLDVAVSSPLGSPVTWKLYRMGWYGGLGARLVASGGPVAAGRQAACPRDPVTSRVECSWTPTFRVSIPAGSLSGVYLIKLQDASAQTYVPVVVHDGRAADLVVNVNVTSWQAYNAFGGESLYEDASGTMPTGKAWEVSYDRPFANDRGAGRFLDWEVRFIQFVEALGYDVTYTTAFDIETDAGQLVNSSAFVSVANDEYWTLGERHAVDAARDAGRQLAFFGADQDLWRVRLQPSRDGRPKRVIACYKDAQSYDPMLASGGDQMATARFRDPPAAIPENQLIGVGYASWMLLSQPWVVADAGHWAFAGTGLRNGDTLPGMVADEFDQRMDNGVEPSGLHVLATSPVVDAQGNPLLAQATYYVAPSNAEVFAVGSIGWPDGLGGTAFVDPRVARITRNVLDRFVGRGHEGLPDPAGATWTQAASHEKVVGEWSPSVTTVAVGDPLVGPGGVAVAPDGTIYVADTPANIIRAIAGGHVTTLAGDGHDGAVDGPGAQARFRNPLGLALGPDGTLYVADAENNVIRAVAPGPDHTVSTIAGVAGPKGGFQDGPGSAARFNRPVGLAFLAPAALVVADMHNHRVRKVTLGGSPTVTTMAGAGAGAPFNMPSAVAAAPDGTVYVVDTFFRAVRRVDGGGQAPALVGGPDVPIGLAVDGNGVDARLAPQGGLVWAGGRLVVADSANDRLRTVRPGPDQPSTRVTTLAGNGRVALNDGSGDGASFAVPLGMAVGPDGAVYVADPGNRAVRRIVLP